MLRRQFLNHALVAGGLASLGQLSWVQASAQALRVARMKGDATYYMSAAGIEPAGPVEYFEFPGGNLVTEAMTSNQLDLGPMSEIPPIFSAERNAPFKLIAVWKSDLSGQAVLTPPGSPVIDFDHLKGRRIGYVRSTTSHYFLLKALNERGLSFADITPVPLTPQDGFAAFKAGQLDAWFIYGIFIQLAKFQANAKVLKTGHGYLSGNIAYAASNEAIANPEKHQSIRAFLLDQQKVWDWQDRNPTQWAQVSEEITGVPAALYLDQYNNRSHASRWGTVDEEAIRSQQQVADLFYETKVLKKPIDASLLWDKSFTL